MFLDVRRSEDLPPPIFKVAHMEVIKLVFTGVLPDLNIELNEAKRAITIGKGAGKRTIPGLLYSNHKKKWTEAIAWQCKEQYKGDILSGPCAFVFDWYFPNTRKDPDNQYFAQKYVFDGLVMGKVLREDKYRNTKGGVLHLPNVDAGNPRLELFIIPNFTFKNPVK